MKKLLLLLVLMAGAFGVASSQTWTSAPASASDWDAILEGSSSTSTKAPTKWTDTSNGLTAEWAFDYNWQNTDVYYTRGKNGIQFGSKKAGIIGMALTTSSFADKKTTTVVVNNAKSNGSAKLSVKVNGVEFKSNSSTAVTLTSTAEDYTFTGLAQGQIEVCFSENGEGKYVGMSGLSVTYEETSVIIGTINAVYETSDGDKEVSGMAQVYTGTKFLFSCENATKISARIGEEVIAANDNGSTVEWISDAREYATVTVEASRGEQIAQPMEFTLVSREEPKNLGEVKITYGDGLDVFNNGQYNVVENTEFAFSAENATSIVVTDIDGNELATGTSSTTWKAVAPAFNKRINVEAKRDDQVENKWFFVTVTEAPKPELGEIVVTYGDDEVVENYGDEITVEEGATFTFSAANATNINVTTWTDESTIVNFDGDKATYTFAVPFEMDGITVTATDGTDTKTFEFFLTVVEAPKPALGEIVVTYGDGNVVSEEDIYGLEVEAGTTFTFSAANATNIKVTTWLDSAVIVDFDGDEATYTFAEPFEQQDGVTVTATNGTDEPKTFEFLLTVTAPYVEPVNPNAEYVYKLVTNKEDIAAGEEYVICASETDRAMAGQNTNNRKSDEVTIENNEIWTLPETVQIVKLSNSNAVEDSFDMQVGETEDGTPQYLYAAGNPANDKNQNYLRTTTSVGESSAAAISIDANNIVKIDFSKATGKQGRYMQYNGTGTNSLFSCYVKEQTNTGYEHMRLFKKTELPGVPEYDEYVDDDTKVAIKIIKGQLHVVVSEYDAEGNEVTEEVVSAASAKAASYVSEPTWTNPVVTDENGMYLISLPEQTGNYIKIQAKNELNGYHSEELVKHVDAAGNILSGVDAIMAEDAAPVEYFNMQGMRVEAGQPGVYVRRQGGKVAKVVVR